MERTKSTRSGQFLLRKLNRINYVRLIIPFYHDILSIFSFLIFNCYFYCSAAITDRQLDSSVIRRLRNFCHFQLRLGLLPFCSSTSLSISYPFHSRTASTSCSKMGLISRTLKITAAGTAASIGVFFGATRNDVFQPMDSSDPIFQSSFFQKYNPNRNPTLHDVCVRRIELSKIEPSLLEKKGKLVEAFCAGVWGGMGELGLQGS